MDEPDSYLSILTVGFLSIESASLTGVSFKLLAIVALVIANAFFVASEFALVSVRRTKLEARAAAGGRRAGAALRLLDNPTLLISATQLGVTLASLALGWAGEPTIASLLEPFVAQLAPHGVVASIAHIFAIVIAFSAITFLHIVLGELMPKMIALERAEAVALFCARPLELFARSFSPLLWIFNKTGSTLGRLIGLKSSLEHTSVYTETELRQLVDISREQGHLRAEERRLIHRV